MGMGFGRRMDANPGDRARPETAEELRERLNVLKAEMFRLLGVAESSDSAGFKIEATFKLEKFDGEYEPGKEPVEVIEGGDGLPTIVTRKEDADGS